MMNMEQVNWSRKPTQASDVEVYVRMLQKEVAPLKTFSFADLGMKVLGSDFNQRTPTYFVLKDHDRLYLVNTEGAQYVRYAARIAVID